MQDNTTIRKYIRHPSDIPITVELEWVSTDIGDAEDETLTNVSLGGLAFVSKHALEPMQKVRVCIPVLQSDNYLIGTVVWCEKSNSGYEIGLEFERKKEAFRLRMIEQICHIEHYRKEVKSAEGRELSTQEAAGEWIAKYASDFPAL